MGGTSTIKQGGNDFSTINAGNRGYNETPTGSSYRYDTVVGTGTTTTTKVDKVTGNPVKNPTTGKTETKTTPSSSYGNSAHPSGKNYSLTTQKTTNPKTGRVSYTQSWTANKTGCSSCIPGTNINR